MALRAYRGRIAVAVLFAVVMGLSSTVAAVALATPLIAAPAGTPSGSPAGSAAPSTPGSVAVSPALSAYEETEAGLQAQYSAVAHQLEASGVPARLIHLPSDEPAGEVDGAVVPGPQYAADLETTSQGYSSSPAPAGIAYYGESGADSGGSEATTVVYSTSLAGSINVTNLTSLYLDTDDPDQWGAQLNAVVTNVSLEGSTGPSADKNGFEFWTQNVIGYQQFNQTLQFDENTWNFSSTAESFPTSGTSTIVAHDINDTLEDGEVYVGESQFFYVPTPFNLTLYTNLSLYNNLICSPYSDLYGSSTCSSPSAALAGYAGDQTLFYNYTITFPATNTKVPLGTHYHGNFDWMTFHTAKGSVEDNGANTRSAGFEASGKHADDIGLANDWELDFGIGAFDGATQDVFGASGTASLGYVNDCSAYVKGTAESCTIPKTRTYGSVPAALNFGSETGETAGGIDLNFVSQTHRLATFSGGPFNLHPLWGYTSEAGVTAGQVAVTNHITVSGSPLTLAAQPYVFLFLEDTSVTAPSDSYSWAPDVPVWYLMPGTYDYEAMLADYTEQTGSFTVSSSPVTVTAALPYATSNGVYTPLWALTRTGAVANAEIAGISSSGSGTLASPYVLFNNNDTAASQELNSVFENKNDYAFPTFPGLLLWNTTAYVQDIHQIEFYTGSSTDGYLQQQLYETQHVTIAKTHNILGWAEQTSLFESTASQNVLPTANVMIWNSTNDLVLSNTILGEKAHSSSYVAQDDLLLYGGGSECSAPNTVGPGPGVTAPCGGNSGPAPAGSENVVWGNTFCDTACTTSPSSPGTYAGIAEAESGDLVYNNNFDVDNPAPLMPWNFATELGPVYYTDTWNVPEQAASHVVNTVNGFALSGNVMNGASGTTYALQGGNHWWNYPGPSTSHCASPYTAIPGCLNSGTNTTYHNQFDYTDGGTTLFPPPYTANQQNGLLGTGDAAPLVGFAVTFSETGLPGGTTWYVNLTLPGQARYTVSSSSASATPLYLADGSYAFTVASANRLYADSSPPTPLVVSGAAKTVSLAFSSVTYAVTFSESALPSGTEWWVNVTGQPAQSSTGPTIVVDEPNGSYSFSAASLDKSYSSAGGAFSVAGAPLTVPVTFSELFAAPYATPNPVDAGEATTIDAGASGGSGSYSYAWSGLPSGCSAGNVASFSCTPSTSGATTVSVTVTDAYGAHVSGSFSLVVNGALSASASATVNPVDEGQATTISAVAGGGSGGDSYAWSGLPSGCGTPGDVASFSCTPALGDAAGSPYTVSVTVTDSAGAQAVASFTLVVDPGMVVSASATVNPVDEGQATTISASASGGSGSYDYAWSGLPAGCTAGDVATFSCTPAAGAASGSPYTVSVSVTDGNGNVTTASFSLVVDPALTANPSATVNPVDVGQATTISANALGGSDYDYAWSNLPSGCGSPGNVASFSCTPVSGDDAGSPYDVTVQVTDRNGNVETGSFELVVDPALGVSASATVNPLDVGQTTTVSASASGGSGSYDYAWSGLPSGCAAGDVASFSCSPTVSGTFTISVTVTDDNGNTATASFDLDVDPALTANPSATVNPMDVGQTTTVSADAAGGSGSYDYAWSGLPSGCAAGDVASFSCSPTVSGTFSVSVTVTDGNGNTVTASFDLAVDSSVSVSASATKNPLDVGQTTTISADVSGGSGGYTYAWSGLPTGCSAGDVASFSCSPTASGTFSVTVQAVDGNGGLDRAAFVLTVDPAVGAGTVSATVNPVTVGSPTTISTTGATGGSGSYAYAWSGLPTGCTAGSVASFSCTPSVTGTFTVVLTVTDTNGGTASASFSLVVGAAPPGTYEVTFTETGLPSGTTWYVNITGEPSLSGTGTSLGTMLANGAYSYHVASANKRYGSPAGTFTVAGAAVSVTVPFAKSTYTLTFTEGGLPAKKLGKAGWTVVLNGTEVHATTASIAFPGLLNGTYPVLITGPAGYEASGSGTVAVHGTTAYSVMMTKGKVVTLTFHEAKLAKGTTWCVEVDGDEVCTTGKSIAYVHLTPASYNYAVESVTGYSVTAKIGKAAIATSGSLAISKSTTVKLTYTATGGGGGEPRASGTAVAGVARKDAPVALLGSLGVVGSVETWTALLGLLGAALVVSGRRWGSKKE